MPLILTATWVDQACSLMRNGWVISIKYFDINVICLRMIEFWFCSRFAATRGFLFHSFHFNFHSLCSQWTNLKCSLWWFMNWQQRGSNLSRGKLLLSSFFITIGINAINQYWRSVMFWQFWRICLWGQQTWSDKFLVYFADWLFLARSWFSKIRSLKTERSLKFEYERAFFRSSLLVVSPGFELSLLKARFNLNKSGCKWDNPLHWMESSCKLKFEKALEVVDLVMGNACL